MKILITGGGCEEPIDNVRAITNFSTGRTSSFLADFFASKGTEVTAIMAERAVKPNGNAKVLTYKTFAQLKDTLEAECKSGNYDAVIQAAAVSDYSPESVIVDGQEFLCGTISKLKPGSEVLIKLKKNPKLLDSIKEWCGKNTSVIGFKLTSNATDFERKAAIEKVFSANQEESLKPDFIVSNDLSEIQGEIHPCKIYSKEMSIVSKTESLMQLAQAILELVEEKSRCC